MSNFYEEERRLNMKKKRQNDKYNKLMAAIYTQEQEKKMAGTDILNLADHSNELAEILASERNVNVEGNINLIRDVVKNFLIKNRYTNKEDADKLINQILDDELVIYVYQHQGQVSKELKKYSALSLDDFTIIIQNLKDEIDVAPPAAPAPAPVLAPAPLEDEDVEDDDVEDDDAVPDLIPVADPALVPPPAAPRPPILAQIKTSHFAKKQYKPTITVNLNDIRTLTNQFPDAGEFSTSFSVGGLKDVVRDFEDQGGVVGLYARIKDLKKEQMAKAIYEYSQASIDGTGFRQQNLNRHMNNNIRGEGLNTNVNLTNMYYYPINDVNYKRQHSTEVNKLNTQPLIHGRGFEPKSKQTEFKPYRKYYDKIYIDLNKLRQNVLFIKYINGNSNVLRLPTQVITEDLKDIIMDTISDRYNKKVYSSLSPSDKRIFQKFIKYFGFNIHLEQDNEEKEFINRYQILRGSYLSGNDSEEIKRELKKYVRLGLANGTVSQKDSFSLLYELAASP